VSAIRVVFVSKIPTPYRLPLYRLLAERPEVDVQVLFAAAAEPNLPFDVRESLGSVRHHFLPGFSTSLPTGREPFAYPVNHGVIAALRVADPDLIVVGGYVVYADQAALLFARRTGIPYVVHNESHLGRMRPAWVEALKAAVLPSLVGGAAGGLAVGSAAARYLAHYGLHPGRIRLFPNTVDVGEYQRAAAAVRRRGARIRSRLDLPRHFVLYAGRLTPSKGIGDLAAALRMLGGQSPELVIAGVGPLSGELGVLPRVRLLGFQPTDRLIELLALADAAVLPSRAETWGVVVNEALACGCPVVVSDAVGAVEDLVVDGVNGRVFPAGDVRALAAALASGEPPGNLRGASGVPPGKRDARAARIRRWDYDFAVEQFLELMRIVLPGRLP
jgi:glycosyltransferase involved in cell wall biosynthesis